MLATRLAVRRPLGSPAETAVPRALNNRSCCQPDTPEPPFASAFGNCGNSGTQDQLAPRLVHLFLACQEKFTLSRTGNGCAPPTHRRARRECSGGKNQESRRDTKSRGVLTSVRQKPIRCTHSGARCGRRQHTLRSSSREEGGRAVRHLLRRNSSHRSRISHSSHQYVTYASSILTPALARLSKSSRSRKR